MKENLLETRFKEGSDGFRHMRAFSQRNRLPLRFFDTRGRILWESRYFQRPENFCHLMNSNGLSKKACLESHRETLHESLRWGEAILSKCCHFIMQLVVPIMDRGRVAGSLVASPFLLIHPSELQPEELVSLSHGKSEKARTLQKALLSLPVVKDEEARDIAQRLFQLADHLSNPDLSDLQKIREAQKLQGRIADRIQDLKDLDKEFTPDSLSKLFYDREKEIVTRIRLGDIHAAREILYQLLAIILVQYLENFELLKVSILELLIILSRAAVEAGAKVEETLGMRYGFIAELAKLRNQEELCVWIVKVLEKMTDRIYQTRNAKNYQRLKRLMDFIEAHYHEPLKVEQLARTIYLSPSRLSHIVKEEFGMPITDCISQVRINRAKDLLTDEELSIAQVAQEVGFADQSYFTKVFKKIEGCTPKAYRGRLFQSLLSKEKLALPMT